MGITLILIVISVALVVWAVLVVRKKVWQPYAWPILATELGNRGWWFFRMPQHSFLAVDLHKSFWKGFLSVVQESYEYWKQHCLIANLRQFANMAIGTEVKINNVKQDEEFLRVCREKIAALDEGSIQPEQLMAEPKFAELLRPIPRNLFDLNEHHNQRKWFMEQDSRMFYLLEEGVGSRIAIPLPWLASVREVQLYEKPSGFTNIPEAKHSVKLREFVLKIFKEGQKEKAIAGMFVPRSLTGDPVEVEAEITSRHKPIDPLKMLYEVEFAVSAAFKLIVPFFGQVTRGLSLRDFFDPNQKSDASVEKAKGKDIEQDLTRSIISRFLLEVDRRFRIAIGQVREVPENLSEVFSVRAKTLFPDGLIPCLGYVVNTDNKALDQDSSVTTGLESKSLPDGEFFKALGFENTPLLDAHGQIKWKDTYVDHRSAVGKIFHLYGLFTEHRISDLDLADDDVKAKLRERLTAQYEASSRITLAGATRVEEQAKRAGEAEGIEAKLKVFKEVAELRGVELAEIGKTLEWYDTLRTMPKDKAQTLFFNLGQNQGTGGGENLTSTQQLLLKLLAESPEILASLTGKKPAGGKGSDDKSGSDKKGAGKKDGKERPEKD
ncbi:MAG: hypothetical protein ABIH38_00130 [Patescibacteria group bacterium]